MGAPRSLPQQVAETLFTDGYAAVVMAWMDDNGEAHFFIDATLPTAVGLASMLSDHIDERIETKEEEDDGD